ncbi:PHB depolymerase family esterase [uncultured Microbulbifer sp.]|uniref:extracellular catalytic domain type 1 short-chain-length polyhydroxyalkanoate depolymerase n=1 Tax=uncultured Microbulbifer sp. TaxID=348147 RepID=UPI0025FEAB76|nr:PHB depolymerase family esterase [uncultured Microbulbifer sp.]
MTSPHRIASIFRPLLNGLLGAALISTSLCASAEAGSWQENVASGGFSKVHIYTPDSRSAIGDGRALLILLHGCVQPIDNYLNANLEAAANEFGMVIAVPDAEHKAGYNCWAYWEDNRDRENGDYRLLIQLAQALAAEEARDIDPAQIYIAGLSSGATFAHTAGCLAPDVFAGVAVSAGPSIGTSPAGALGNCEVADVARRCADYAGSYKEHFSTQVFAVAHGSEDTVVDPCYLEQNAEGMAELYGVARLPGSDTLREGDASAELVTWQQGRVGMLTLNGVGHSWSGGTGATGQHIDDAGVNLARQLAQFFRQHNRRTTANHDT